MNLHIFNKNINCNIIQYNKNINTSLTVQHGAVRVSKNFVHSGCHRISSSGLFVEDSSLAHVIRGHDLGPLALSMMRRMLFK